MSTKCTRQFCHPYNDRTPQKTDNNSYRLQRRRWTKENKFNFIENGLTYGTVAKIASYSRRNDVFPVMTA